MSLLLSSIPILVADDHLLPGSGIYVAPAIVLQETGGVGPALLLWTLGAVLSMSGLLVFLELGLSLPKFQPPDAPSEPPREGEKPLINMPRNGGAKNYVSSRIETCLDICS